MDRGDLSALTQLRLTKGQLESMRSHVDSCLPHEGCGLLAGKAGVVQEIIPVTNDVRSPVRFRMNPQEQLRAFDWMEDHGLELLGVFHSHPDGPAGLSPTDIAEAAYPVVYLIWSRGQGAWKVNGFWIEETRVSEVKLYAADRG